MIKSLEIKNFQSYRDQKFEFSPGVNVFIGKTDSGKSAIWRAIRWVLFNQPSGSAFVRHGKRFVSVSIEINGHTLTRYRSKSKNYYELDGIRYNAIGKSIPQEISSVINMDPEINLQGQFDPPFLLGESPGKIAKRLNDVSHLDIIDKLIAKVSKRKSNHNSRIKLLEEQIQEIETQIKDFPEDQIKKTIDLITEWTKVKTKLEDITRIKQGIDSQTKIIAKLERDYLPKKTILQKIMRLKKEWDRTAKQLKGILWYKKQIEKTERAIERLKDEINKLQLRYKKNKPKRCPLCGGKFQ